ncbi:phosphatidylglycerophosphatase A [candidate division KSB1 bacterium]|nr:phosphatidylglycerophosphatase A [candidate division KSB1 bacterium]
MSFIARLIATGFYTGYAPKAPGTAGSLFGLFLYWAIPESKSVYSLVGIALIFFTGVWAANQVEKETKVHDNQIIVIDEIVGMLITVALFEKTLIWLVVGFLLFRFFDIMKPFPAKSSEKIPHGWGVMMDDVIAGIYSALCLRLIYYFLN